MASINVTYLLPTHDYIGIALGLESVIRHLLWTSSCASQNWPCKLSVQQHFESSENIIIQAKLEEVEKMYNQSLSHDLLKREKVSLVHQSLRWTSMAIGLGSYNPTAWTKLVENQQLFPIRLLMVNSKCLINARCSSFAIQHCNAHHTVRLTKHRYLRISVIHCHK